MKQKTKYYIRDMYVVGPKSKCKLFLLVFFERERELD